MPSLTYYWTGSTLGNQEQFNWTNLQNWKTLRLPTGGVSGGTLATLQNATRLPMGGDVINFGFRYEPRTSWSVGPFPIWSPLLFGGITTSGGTVGLTSAWSGTTLGSTVVEKYGNISCIIYSSYPFSKLGGEVNDTVMSQLNVQTASLTGTTGFGWARVQGGTGATGGPQFGNNEWVSTRNWLGQSGFAYGISLAAQPASVIRWRGEVRDWSKSPTETNFAGITTPGLSGVNATSFDGRSNEYSLSVNGHSMNNPTNPNENFGNSVLLVGNYVFDEWRPVTALTLTVPVPGDVYEHGAIELTGAWNRILSTNSAIRGLNMTMRGVRANAVAFVPTNNYITINEGRADAWTTITPGNSRFDLEKVFLDKDCSVRNLMIQNLDGGTYGEIIVHGDINSSGGFPCVGATSGGASGPFGSLPQGTFVYTAPEKNANIHRVVIGYPQTEGTKATTSIDNVYLYRGVCGSSTVTLEGNVTSLGVYVYGGTMAFSPNLPPAAAFDMSVFMYADSALDFSPPFNYRGQNNTVVYCNSDQVRVIPGNRQLISFASMDG